MASSAAARTVRVRARGPKVGARREALKRSARKGGAVSPRVKVAEMQRARLLGAAVVTVDELGWGRASVAHITARARVSRRTFYDLFANREDCLAAVLDDAAARVEGELSAASLDTLPWCERVRTGLSVILSFFDREPVLARVCVVQALRGGPRVLARREEILARLAGVLDQGRTESARAKECPPLTAEGLVGAVFSIVYARLVRGERESLMGLSGELVGLIVLPYLGPAAARRERRGTRTFSSGRERPADLKSPTRFADLSLDDPLAELPMRLTYRTARVLEVVGEQPGASNRVVAQLAGIQDQGQVSKLLARLERLGLLVNMGEGHARGERNVWSLTPTGVRVADGLRGYPHAPSHDVVAGVHGRQSDGRSG